MLKLFVLYVKILELNEVSHVDWKTQVGALFISGLGLHPTTINRAPPLHSSLLIHKRVESTHTLSVRESEP